MHGIKEEGRDASRRRGTLRGIQWHEGKEFRQRERETGREKRREPKMQREGVGTRWLKNASKKHTHERVKQQTEKEDNRRRMCIIMSAEKYIVQ